MERIRILIVASLSLAALACSQSPRTIKSYEKDGIRFSHFSDWAVTNDSANDDSPESRSIDLEGPNDAIVTFIFLPASTDHTLEEFAESVAEQRVKLIEEELSVGPLKAAEVNKGTSEPIKGRVGGQERSGILQRFSVTVLGEKVPHEARFFSVANKRHNVIILAQVATEDAKETAAAFELTLASFSIKDLK